MLVCLASDIFLQYFISEFVSHLKLEDHMISCLTSTDALYFNILL